MTAEGAQFTGLRMKPLNLGGGLNREARSDDWERYCRCGPKIHKGGTLRGGQTPARHYRGNPWCNRCQSFVWIHGAPEWRWVV